MDGGLYLQSMILEAGWQQLQLHFILCYVRYFYFTGILHLLVRRLWATNPLYHSVIVILFYTKY